MTVTRRAVPVTPREGLSQAFASAPLVGIGEVHWCERSLDFIIELLEDGALAARIDDIVVEFGNARHQALVDRYLAGEEIDPRTLSQAWRDTLHFMLWSPEVYARFFRCVRALNRHRPPARRLRILLAEEAFDWRGLCYEQWQRLHLRRDVHYQVVIEREVLARGRRALLIFGSTHLLKRPHPEMMSPSGPAMPLGARLCERHGDVLKVIWPYFAAKGDFLTPAERAAWPIPSITWLAATELAERTFIPPFAASAAARVRVDGVGDACLYLGALERRVEAPRSIAEDPAWLAEIARRAALLGEAHRARIERLLPQPARQRMHAATVLQ